MNTARIFMKHLSKGTEATLAKSSTQPARRLILGLAALVGLALLAPGAAFAEVAPGKSAPISNRVQGELLSVGTMRYKLGSSPWLPQERGAMMVLLPVTLQTDKAPCRLVIPNLGTFQADADTQFTLALEKDNKFTLSVDKGSVFYSLGMGMTMRINSPVPGMGANVGSINRGGPIGMFSTNSARYSPTRNVNGQEAANGIHLFNVNGDVQFEQNGQPVRTVSAGRALHVYDKKPAPKKTWMKSRNGLTTGSLVLLDNPVPSSFMDPAPRPGSTDNLSGPDLKSGFGGGAYYDENIGRTTEQAAYAPASPF